MKISLLINMKMPTIVGIFIFISGEIFMFSWVEREKCFITSGPDQPASEAAQSGKSLCFISLYSNVFTSYAAQENSEWPDKPSLSSYVPKNIYMVGPYVYIKKKRKEKQRKTKKTKKKKKKKGVDFFLYNGYNCCESMFGFLCSNPLLVINLL